MQGKGNAKNRFYQYLHFPGLILLIREEFFRNSRKMNANQLFKQVEKISVGICNMDLAVAEIKKRLLIYRRKQYLRDFLLTLKTKTPPELTLLKLLKRSEKFPLEFPILSVKSASILQVYLRKGVGKEIIERKLLENAREAYPIIHESFFEMAIDFLEHKRKFGSEIEQKLYYKLNLLSLIGRLIRKRAVCFYGRKNQYLLLNGRNGAGWKDVGKENETEPLTLENCLSFDEMKLSALISYSSPSYFVNDGSRTNGGILPKTKDYEERGIVIGVVGCKFQERGFMDYQDMLIDPEQNIKKHGYGMDPPGEEAPGSTGEKKEQQLYEKNSDFLNIFAKHNNKEYYPLWEEVREHMSIKPDNNHNTLISDSEMYIKIPHKENCYFAKDVYTNRIRVTAEVILLEANQRGIKKNQKVFLHIGGFGDLQLCPGLEALFLEGFAQAIHNLDLSQISDIFFSFFQEGTSCGGVENNGVIGKNEIKIHFGMRYPHEKLQGGDFHKQEENKLSVVTYACGENSIAGNEFWVGLCAASGDSSQASSSQITELHNPHINPMISGNNIRVASPSLGSILPISEYLEIQLSEMISVKRSLCQWLGEVKDLPYPSEESKAIHFYDYFPYRFK